MTPLELARFVAKVVTDEHGCWIWTGARVTAGYGKLWVDVDGRRRTQLSHRLAYQHLVGEIPIGQEIDHKCRVRSCCNPEHLQTLSHAENMRLSVWSDSSRARMSAVHLGKVVSAETRARMANAAKSGWLKRKARAA